MLNISVSKPANEPFSNPKYNKEEWESLYSATQRIPHCEIPMVIHGEKVYSSVKHKNKNPSTGKEIGTYQQATEEHAKSAIEAALSAKPEWSALSPYLRIQKMRDLEAILIKWKHEMCATAMVECGFNGLETYVEWAELIDFIRFNNYFYSQLLSSTLGDGFGETNQMVLRPLKGFTCAVTPFNFPQAIGYHLPLVMALMGNTVVWKPSEDVPISSYLLMRALDLAGFPKGVINMITGDGKECLKPILTHPKLSALNFTGSFATARAFGNYLYNTQYERFNFPRFVAETGGKDFLVADKDIDVLDTARAILQGAFGRSGQKCSANSVVFVHEVIWPELQRHLVQEAQKLNVSKTENQNCDVGPVINEKQFDKIASYIDIAQKDPNCKILVGGTYNKKEGYFIQPTIVEVSTSEHILLKEEIFGPFVTVRTYREFNEVVKAIEQHEYRLTGSVISRNETVLNEMISLFHPYAGNFYINRKTTGAIVHMQPFGGDGASGTNAKAGNVWYLLNFTSQATLSRRHDRSTTPSAFNALLQ
jgi:1-pyrroline-5-carboxylate dehydrogenase